MQDRTGLTVFLVRVVFVLFETRRFCKVARFVFPDLITSAMGTLNFYTSDMNGIYIITLQGISVDGREIRMQSEFVVGANH